MEFLPTVGPSEENGKFMLKRCKFPDGFQRRLFKGKVRDRVTECRISFWVSI